MSVALHLARPLQKAPEAGALSPQEFPELKKTNLRHLDPAIRFDPPKQVWTSPRSQAMAPGGIPHKAERRAHGSIITTSIALCQSTRNLPYLLLLVALPILSSSAEREGH